MKKTLKLFSILLILTLLITSCKKQESSQFQKFTTTFFNAFDTNIKIVGYTETEEEFEYYAEKIKNRFEELHKLYDIYFDYEGINNIKTINDNAGIQPVKVKQEIIDLIVFSKKWYSLTDGATNIAMGPVLRIWSSYRDEAEFDPLNAEIPPMDELLEASKYTDIEDVIVDEKNSTVFLKEKEMKLDVGAVAKGFATEIIAKEIVAEGFSSGLISAGGNVRVLDKPLDGIREKWGIGISNPDNYLVPDESNLIDTIFLNNASVVTSGDYQRYYVVDDKIIHHLIDPKTLMPGDYFRAVTVVAEDSGVADFLSTSIFLMPYEKGHELIENLDNVEALWIMKNGEIKATEGMKKIMKSHGATGSK